MSSPRLLQALQSNASLRPNELAEIGKKLAALEASPAAESGATEADAPDEVVEGAVIKYLEENAAELVAEKDKPFQPIGMAHDGMAHEGMAHEDVSGEAAHEVGAQAAAATASANADAAKSTAVKSAAAGAGKSAAAAAHAKKHPVVGHEERRDSTLQKISKLDIKGRISLAMRGSKEERSILIRDGTKLVALAVLESPKVSDGEVEGFALQKNVLESVLRAIPMKRRFAKNYNITRNLVYNPRTPLDLSLGLMKGLLIHDLKNLSGNKEVSDTIRKLALRMFKQKMEKKG
jgi:cellobiose-specific phosphotransferase system component IIB